jgi:hypothetical protein
MTKYLVTFYFKQCSGGLNYFDSTFDIDGSQEDAVQAIADKMVPDGWYGVTSSSMGLAVPADNVAFFKVEKQ